MVSLNGRMGEYAVERKRGQMTKKSKNPCSTCDCWDSDAEGCTMPHSDKWYACPIESAKPENQRALEDMAAEYAERQKEDTL